MKPSKIFDMMDLARRAREKDEVFNPLFVGAPGIGKSQIVQQWCKARGLSFIDLRAAYLEAPDLIGFPSIHVVNGRSITVHNTPEFWPQDPDSEGVVIFEEPNRGTTSVLNTLMQILTDRRVHLYTLPKKWLVVGCINPEGQEYDVNVMDAALKDRFEIFEVEYDRRTFIDFMEQRNWDTALRLFVESGAWQYVKPEDIGSAPGAKYISPRTFSKVNAALMAGIQSQEDEIMIYESVLGKNIGRQFLNFKYNDQPVTYNDLVKNKSAALDKLRKFCDVKKGYKTGYISITIRDIVDANKIDDALLADVVKVLPADQAYTMLRELEYRRKDDTIVKRLCKAHKEILENLRAVLNTK